MKKNQHGTKILFDLSQKLQKKNFWKLKILRKIESKSKPQPQIKNHIFLLKETENF